MVLSRVKILNILYKIQRMNFETKSFIFINICKGKLQYYFFNLNSFSFPKVFNKV